MPALRNFSSITVVAPLVLTDAILFFMALVLEHSRKPDPPRTVLAPSSRSDTEVTPVAFPCAAATMKP